MSVADTTALDDPEVASLDKIRASIRNCYILTAANSIWLLIPAIGLILGNNLNMILSALVLGGFVLFLRNNYIGKKIYYLSSAAENSVFKSHLNNVDNIGYIVFFVTLIGGLTFLLTTVFILNGFKSQSGYVMFVIVDVILSGLLGALAFWVLKHSLGGLVSVTKSQAYTYKKIANIF
jgi:hypothetical protein